MSEKFSLAYLTTAPLQAPAMIDLARAIGFDSVGVRLSPPAPDADASLLHDAGLQRETVSRMNATGVAIFDVEVLKIGPLFDPSDHARFIEISSMLGASVILVIADDRDESRLTDRFGELCDLAAPYRLDVQLEFMPCTSVPDARSALRIVGNAARSNGKILIDTLHVARSGTTLDDLSAIPASMLRSVQICDAPLRPSMRPEEIWQAALTARLPPGEGDIDIAGILSRLPNDLRIGVEVPNSERIATMGAAEWARKSFTASKLAVEQARNRTSIAVSHDTSGR